MFFQAITVLLVCAGGSAAFEPSTVAVRKSTARPASLETEDPKTALLRLLRTEPTYDELLVDPLTGEDLEVSTKSTVLAGNLRPRITYQLKSKTNVYQGTSDAYINLLEPVQPDNSQDNPTANSVISSWLTPLVPPPLRGLLSDESYIPMRDLFTSPAVSSAYERGWRQGFSRAGFPGPDTEAGWALDYFAPVMANNNNNENNNMVVDMSCATGLFTRRFAQSQRFQRVLGCDYSDSMLSEAQRRVTGNPALAQSIEWIRLDVAQMPFRNDSVPVLHAGAAMHCWPDLPAAVAEIYRVLQPGGRYLATTFLSSYFSQLQQSDATPDVSKMAFQYFSSTDQLKQLLVEKGGFSPDKVHLEVVGPACIVIRCEK